jgi:hypothetical protein
MGRPRGRGKQPLLTIGTSRSAPQPANVSDATALYATQSQQFDRVQQLTAVISGTVEDHERPVAERLETARQAISALDTAWSSLSSLSADIDRFFSFEAAIECWPLDELASRTNELDRTASDTTSSAWHATQIVDGIEIIREMIRHRETDRAAAFALRLGWHLAHVIGLDEREPRRRGGLTRAARQFNATSEQLARTYALVERWHRSDELQEQFPSAATYVAKKLNVTPRTVRRRLKRRRCAQ